MINIVELCWMLATYREPSASSLVYNSDNRIDCRRGPYKTPRQKNPPVLQVSLRVNLLNYKVRRITTCTKKKLE